MKKEVFKRGAFEILRGALLPVVFTFAVIAVIAAGLWQTEASSKSEALRTLEDSLMRAAVKCYAVEGYYPDNVSYMEERYGVHVDKSRYAVHYEIFASNILPNITVIELKR